MLAWIVKKFNSDMLMLLALQVNYNSPGTIHFLSEQCQGEFNSPSITWHGHCYEQCSGK